MKLTLTYSTFCAAALLSIPCSAFAATITYVDAVKGASGNTFATGNLLGDTSWESGANSSSADADQWVERTGLTYLNGADNAFQAREKTSTAVMPELTTQIGGLADGTYDVYVFFWDSIADGNGWNISAGLTSGALSSYSFDGGGINTGVVAASSLSFSETVSTSDGENLVMYGVKIGQQTIVGGAGTIDVYVDHLIGGSVTAQDSANRTWYDGVGYSVIPEPSTSALIVAFLAFGAVMYRRRK